MNSDNHLVTENKFLPQNTTTSFFKEVTNYEEAHYNIKQETFDLNDAQSYYEIEHKYLENSKFAIIPIAQPENSIACIKTELETETKIECKSEEYILEDGQEFLSENSLKSEFDDFSEFNNLSELYSVAESGISMNSDKELNCKAISDHEMSVLKEENCYTFSKHTSPEQCLNFSTDIGKNSAFENVSEFEEPTETIDIEFKNFENSEKRIKFMNIKEMVDQLSTQYPSIPINIWNAIYR